MCFWKFTVGIDLVMYTIPAPSAGCVRVGKTYRCLKSPRRKCCYSVWVGKIAGIICTEISAGIPWYSTVERCREEPWNSISQTPAWSTNAVLQALVALNKQRYLGMWSPRLSSATWPLMKCQEHFMGARFQDHPIFDRCSGTSMESAQARTIT